MRLKRKLRKGFTLVELVIVIAVIAILAAVSVGAYFGVTDSANSSNATAALKQVKDMWLLYSVEEYDSSMSEDEVGNGFAVDYLTYQGYNTYVNYAVVNYQENPNYQAQGNDTYETGVLFKIETQYPTWILVEGDRIIAESEVCKTEEDFINSLSSGKYVISGINSAEDFVLTTLIDNNGNEIRGIPYIKYIIESNSDSDSFIMEDPRYFNANLSLFEADGTFNPELTTGIASEQYDDKYNIALASEPLWLMKEIVDGNERDYDTRVVNSYENKIIESVPDEKNILNGYVTKEVHLKQYWAKLDASEIPSIEEYPVILFDGKNFVYYKSLDDLSGSHIVDENIIDNMPNNETYKASDLSTYYYILNYGNKSTLNKPLNIKDGYIFAVDYKEYEGISTAINFVSNYIAGLSNSFAKFNDASIAPEGKVFDSFETDEFEYSQKEGDTYKSIHKREKNYGVEHNKVTIGEGGSLNFSNDSKIMIESIVKFASGSNFGFGILDHGSIYNSGKINLNDGTQMRVFGKIYGESDAVITTQGNSQIFDIFKLCSFMGGSRTYTSYNSKIFPFYDYRFDNIQCKLELNSDASYYCSTGVYADGDKYPVYGIEYISNSNNSFIIMEDESQLDIDFNDNYRTQFTFKKGEFKFGELKFSIRTSFGSIDIKSSEYQFPICNMDLIIGGQSIINVDGNNTSSKKLEMILMPNSSITNYGVVNFINNSKMAIFNLNSNDYDEMLSKIVTKENVGKESVFLIGDVGYYNMLKNDFLFNYITMLKENYSFNETFIKNDGEINIDNTSLIKTKNEIELSGITDNSLSNSSFVYKFMVRDQKQFVQTYHGSSSTVNNLINGIISGLSKLGKGDVESLEFTYSIKVVSNN